MYKFLTKGYYVLSTALFVVCSFSTAEANKRSRESFEPKLERKDEKAKKNRVESLSSLEVLANQGDAIASYKLGSAYYEGLGVQQDPAKGVKWFHKAADQGNAHAQYILGSAYCHGKGIEQDRAEGMKWFHKAADQGHTVAQYILGSAYYEGQGVEQDRAVGMKWYRKAADQGYAAAQYNLGVAYTEGKGIGETYDAVKWYLKAAGQGHTAAQHMLGVAYSIGRGVERDKAEGMKWYRKAAEQGYAAAQYSLGVAYHMGDVEQDPVESVKWFRKAAEQGHAGAQYRLGLAYTEGTCVTQDQAEGVKWFHKAADQGYAAARHSIAVAYFEGKIIKQDHKASFWYSLLDKKTNPGFNHDLLNTIMVHYKPRLTPSPLSEAEFVYDLEDSPLGLVENLSMRLAELNRRSYGTLLGDEETFNPSVLPLSQPRQLDHLYNNINDIRKLLEETLPQALSKPGFLITNLSFAYELLSPPEGSPYMQNFTVKGQNYLCLGKDNVKAAQDILTFLSATIPQAKDIINIMILEINSSLKTLTLFPSLTDLEENSTTKLNELKGYYQKTAGTLEELREFMLQSGSFIEKAIHTSVPSRNESFKDEFGACIN